MEHDAGESDQRSAGIDEEVVHGRRCSGRVGKIGRERRHDAPGEADRGNEHGEQPDPDRKRLPVDDVCSCMPPFELGARLSSAIAYSQALSAILTVRLILGRGACHLRALA